MTQVAPTRSSNNFARPLWSSKTAVRNRCTHVPDASAHLEAPMVNTLRAVTLPPLHLGSRCLVPPGMLYLVFKTWWKKNLNKNFEKKTWKKNRKKKSWKKSWKKHAHTHTHAAKTVLEKKKTFIRRKIILHRELSTKHSRMTPEGAYAHVSYDNLIMKGPPEICLAFGTG